jgi:hypothetical protein
VLAQVRAGEEHLAARPVTDHSSMLAAWTERSASKHRCLPTCPLSCPEMPACVFSSRVTLFQLTMSCIL